MKSKHLKLSLLLIAPSLLFAFQNFSPTGPIAVAPLTLVPPLTSGSCNLPRVVSHRIGLAQNRDNRFLPEQLGALSRRDFVWADTQPTVSKPFATLYMPSDRLPRALANGEGVLMRTPRGLWQGSALKTRAASVIYSDKKIPSVEYAYCAERSCSFRDLVWDGSGRATCKTDSDFSCTSEQTTYGTPLDITSTEARSAIYCASLSTSPSCAPSTTPPVAQPFRSLALDDVSSTNMWGRSQLFREEGWIYKYTGARIDPGYTADVVQWMSWLGSQAHKDGLCISANNVYDPLDIKGFLEVADAVDINVDSVGFTRDASTEAGKCRPEPLYVNSDANCDVDPAHADVKKCAWTRRMEALESIAQDTRSPKGLVVLEKTCSHLADFRSEHLIWPLANYLLIKGDRSYIAIDAADSVGQLVDFPEMSFPVGQAKQVMQTDGKIYWRQFENALVIVNPSQSLAATHALPEVEGGWLNLAGKNFEHNVQLAPQQAIILTESAWKRGKLAFNVEPGDQKFAIVESPVLGSHEVTKFLNGSPSKGWSVSVSFRPLGERDLRLYLVDENNEKNGVSSICHVATADQPATILSKKAFGTGAAVKSEITKQADGSYVCELSGITHPDSKKLRLILATVQDGEVRYAGDGKSGVQVQEVRLQALSD